MEIEKYHKVQETKNVLKLVIVSIEFAEMMKTANKQANTNGSSSFNIHKNRC